MTSLQPTNRRRGLAALAAALLAALAVATSPARAANEPPAAIETVGQAGIAGPDFWSMAFRRGRAPEASEWPRNRGGADAAPRSLVPGFLLDRGRFTAFEAPDTRVETLPYDIDDRGRIVGRYFDGAGEQAFMRNRAGRFTTIRIAGAQSAWASGINNRGQIVGIYSENTPNVKDPDAKQHGFLWDHGRLTRIDVPGAASTGAFGINDRRQVVGEYEKPRGTSHGFLWSKGRFRTIDRPGAAGTVPYGINNHGQIVGGSFDTDDLAAGRIHGFLMDKGRYTIFDAPGVPVTVPYGINNRGRITGITLTPTEADPVAGGRGFLLRKGVDGRFTPIDFPGAPRTFVTGLNDHGQIVGGYENPDAGLGSPGTEAP